MARAMWTGTVAFGPVSVPVKMYVGAEHKAGNGLHLICAEHKVPIKMPRQCRIDGKELSVVGGEIVRATEVDGQWVALKDEELDALPLHTMRIIEVMGFVPRAEVPMATHANGCYYLEPEKDKGERPYVLLRAALLKSNTYGLAKVGMREKEQLCALGVDGKVITLTTLAWPESVRGVEDLRLPTAAPAQKELDMALMLVEALEIPWTPADYKDEYRAALAQLVADKAKGKHVIGKRPKVAKDAGDLLEGMKAFVDSQKKGKGKRGKAA